MLDFRRQPVLEFRSQDDHDLIVGGHSLMRTELDILRDVSIRLADAGIGFMLTGSIAMNYYAQPRMTRDIDIVAALKPGDADRVVGLFSPDYYLNPDWVADAINRRGIFNLIHYESVVKVDFVVLKDEPYRREEFARRQRIQLGDFETWIVTREDLILSKLYWAKDTRSEMQLRDASNLLACKCDLDYLRSRAKGLGIHTLLAGLIGHHD